MKLHARQLCALAKDWAAPRAGAAEEGGQNGTILESVVRQLSWRLRQDQDDPSRTSCAEALSELGDRIHPLLPLGHSLQVIGLESRREAHMPMPFCFGGPFWRGSFILLCLQFMLQRKHLIGVLLWRSEAQICGTFLFVLKSL